MQPPPRLMPIVFLDFDDVICLNAPYGVHDLTAPVPPSDLYARLFDASCVSVLGAIDREHGPRFVLTTSWLRLMDQDALAALLTRCGLDFVATGLHSDWEAPPATGATRAGAIESWIGRNAFAGPFVILDDRLSGTGLADSPMACNTVLCAVDEGLVPAHLDAVRRILQPD